LDKSTLADLERALSVLYEKETEADLASDPALSSQLLRMAARLITGFLTFTQSHQWEDGQVLGKTKEVFELNQKLTSSSVLLSFAQMDEMTSPLVGAIRTNLASLAYSVGIHLVESLKRICHESCNREIAAHERSVTQTYRMSGKELSGKESPTAAKVLHPLFEMLEGLAGVLDEENAFQFTEGVLKEVLGHYTSMADMVVKRETSLLRLHQSRNKSNAMSDSHKITKQCALDAARFVKDVKGLVQKMDRTDVFDMAPYDLVVETFNGFGSG
jgi:hypothetical protein